jgi:hypothetical protein
MSVLRRPKRSRPVGSDSGMTGGDTPPLESLVARVRGEYREMPGLRLTCSQACRLWQEHISTCEMVLEELVREGFLYRTDTGAYIAAPTTLTNTRRAVP